MMVNNGLTVGPNYRPLKEIVLRNAARCNGCGEVLESVHRHDFRTCSCGGLMVDGGKDYIRRGFHSEGPSNTDLSVVRYEEMSNEEIAMYHEYSFW